MDLQSVCRDVMDDVDGSLGCVLTDLETGLPLAAEYRAGTVMNANTITLVSYVGIDLFRGKLVRNFERSLSRNREGSGGFVREVQMTTSNTYQFMSSVPGWEQVVFILVTNKNVSLGMGLLAVHDAVRRFREIPRRAFAPAVNPTFRPREEASEPSTPTLTQPLEQRRTEPQRDSTFDAPERPEATRERTFDAPEQREAARERTFEAPEQREPTRERKLETPQPPDTGSEPQPERRAASLDQGSRHPGNAACASSYPGRSAEGTRRYPSRANDISGRQDARSGCEASGGAASRAKTVLPGCCRGRFRNREERPEHCPDWAARADVLQAIR